MTQRLLAKDLWEKERTKYYQCSYWGKKSKQVCERKHRQALKNSNWQKKKKALKASSDRTPNENFQNMQKSRIERSVTKNEPVLFCLFVSWGSKSVSL